MGSGLVGVLYVLDEPSIGLHQRDNRRLLNTLTKLRDLGNTLIVVEHDEETIRAADYVVDVGPGAGVHGGEIIASGSVEDIESEERSVTGDFLARRRRVEPPEERREPTGAVSVLGASENNLKSVDAEFPLGVFTCVTGVSGSGKSTLVNEILYKALANAVGRGKHRPGRHAGLRGVEDVDKVIEIDQSPDRADAALQPRYLHQDLRSREAALRLDAGGQDPGLQAGTLLVQRQGRALRGVSG